MATAVPVCRTARKRSAQARIEESGPKASAERSEGTMEARQGRDAAGGSMRHAHDSATGHLPGDARIALAWVPQSRFINSRSGTDKSGRVQYAVKHLKHQGQTVSSSQTVNPQQACEDLLLEGKQYNIEHHILPSENAVADRLLARGVELKDAYDELHGKLHARPPALQVFLGLVLSTAAFWNPQKMLKARTARNDLTNVNQQIARKANELAELLDQRTDLHNTSGFSSETHYHVGDVIEAASQNNCLFQSYVQEKLDALRGQFDLKYWPSLGDFMRELASDAEKAEMAATDPLTAAATAATRPSKADFFKALFASIEENSTENYGQLPRAFKLTDRTLASLANCALDLGPDELVDEAYVKRLRQRERNGTE